MSSFYDKDYYENGLQTGKSNYQNYRWIPELTIPLAMTMIDYLEIKRHDTILDFGCAKGYLVKAFRMLYRDAWGIDSSEYAIQNCDPEAEPYCNRSILNRRCPPFGRIESPIHFDFCIMKDVLEHLQVFEIEIVLRSIEANTFFIIVPLGDRNGYYSHINDLDKSHILCEPLNWWISLFERLDFVCKKVVYEIPGIKDAYYANCANAHGFFTISPTR